MKLKNAPVAKDVGAARANHFSPNCAPPVPRLPSPVVRAPVTPVVSRTLFLTLLALAGSAVVRATDGPAVFATHCAACHGLDGKARTPAGKKLGAKDLSESKTTDDAIAHQIAEGLKDKKGAERMPSFKSRLSADEIAALVTFVKTFRR